MSASATPAVLRALESAPDGPLLIYDLGLVAARMRAARDAAHLAGVALLYAIKSFPVPAALSLAAAHLDGLDVAGPEEQTLALTLGLAPTTLSVTWPGDVDPARISALVTAGHRVTVVCETATQVATAAGIPGVALALRLRADPDSRFGTDDLRAAAAPAPDRIRALHVHGGPLAISPAVLADRARRALAAADAAGLRLDQLDLGGSLHGFALDRPTSGQSRLADAFAAARAAVPAAIRLLFEPGRLWTEGAGFAAGRILASRADHHVLSLSRLAHLRWSTPRLVAPPPRATDPRATITLLGATCCEDDHIGDATLATTHAATLTPGTRILLAGITGYAAAWNRGFAGVPAAHLLTPG